MATLTNNKVGQKGRDRWLGGAGCLNWARPVRRGAWSFSQNMKGAIMSTHKKKNVIGMIVPTVDNPFFASLVCHAESILNDKGYGLLVCNSAKGVRCPCCK